MTDVRLSAVPFLLTRLSANQNKKNFEQCSLNELKVPYNTNDNNNNSNNNNNLFQVENVGNVGILDPEAHVKNVQLKQLGAKKIKRPKIRHTVFTCALADPMYKSTPLFLRAKTEFSLFLGKSCLGK